MTADKPQPDQERQGSLGVGHAATPSHEGIDLLAGQTEHAAEMRLCTISPQVRTEFATKLIPERGVAPGPERLPGIFSRLPSIVGQYQCPYLAVGQAHPGLERQKYQLQRPIGPVPGARCPTGTCHLLIDVLV
jgi:hypothetical protein